MSCLSLGCFVYIVQLRLTRRLPKAKWQIMKEKSPATVAIVDEHLLTRKTLSCRLFPLGFNTVLEAENVKEFIDQMAVHPVPDICLVDIKMPVSVWLETVIRLKKNWPGTKILYFSMPVSEAYISQLMEIGVDGFISKKSPFKELHNALLNTMKKSGNFKQQVDVKVEGDKLM